MKLHYLVKYLCRYPPCDIIMCQKTGANLKYLYVGLLWMWLMLNHKVVYIAKHFIFKLRMRWVTSLRIYHSICWWNIFLNRQTFGEVTGNSWLCHKLRSPNTFVPELLSAELARTCVLCSETVTNCCYFNRLMKVSSLSTNIKLL